MKVSIKLHIIFLAVIAIWTTLIYSNSLDNGFHFDDLSNIKESSNVRSFDDAWSAGMRRVVVITFYINYALGGFDVRYYHVVNIAFHIINAFLIYFLTLVTLRRIDSDSKYILFATPLIFALHPLNTEPINYIVQRTIIICTTFYILSILLFSLSFPLNSKKIGIIRTALCWAGCLFSLTLCIFSKEVSITLPLMLILYYVYFISANIKWFLRWFPLFLLLVIVVTIIASSMGIFESAVKQISHVDPLKHIFINLVAQANVAVEYLGIALLPLPSFLNVDHDVRWTDDFLNIQTLLSISIILLLIFLLFWLFNRNRLASFALLWMFLTHAPTSIMPRQEIMVEYRNYLPLFGFAIFVAIYLEMVFLKIKSNKVIPYAITLIMCVLFSIAVVERNKVWKDDETLWKDTVSKSPNKSRVHSGLAYHYYKTGRYDDAIVEAKKAIELDRSWLVPYVNLGLSYAHKKNSNGAIYWLSEVIKLYEDVNAFKKLLPPLYKELDLVPGLPSRIAVEAYNGIGTVYMDLGKYKEAEDNLKKAINILPTYGDAYLNLGVVYFRMNKIDEAMLYGKKALRYDPVSWEPHYFLSLMYLGKGDKVKAKEYFEAGRKFIRGTPKEKEQEIRLKKMLGK